MLYTKAKPGDTVYWITVDTNYWCNVIPIQIYPVMRVHKGKVVDVPKTGTINIRTFVNKDVIDSFNGHVKGIKMMPMVKGGLPEAVIGMRAQDLYSSEAEVKMKMVEFIAGDFDTEQI